MNSFSPAFLQKYQELRGNEIRNAEEFAALHNTLNGNTVFAYLGIDANEVDRALLHSCATDRKSFEREFSGPNFNVFRQSEFVFRDEAVFNSYLAYLEYHKVEAILLSDDYDDERRLTEICKAIECTRSEAKAIIEAAEESRAPEPPVLIEHVDEYPDNESPELRTTELSEDVRTLSDLLLELNKRSIVADISPDSIYSYTAYDRDTQKKFAPLIIDFFVERWNSAQEHFHSTINHILAEYDKYVALNVANLLFDFDSLPSAQELPATHGLVKARFTKEVEPVLLGCEKYYVTKCDERIDYIVHRRVEYRLQHIRDVADAMMEIIGDFVDDKTIAKNIIIENVCDGSLVYAAQICIAVVRLQRITAYLRGLLLEMQRLCGEMHAIARDLRYLNSHLAQVKEEYESAYYGEKVLYELKGVSIFSRKDRKDEKKDELEMQRLLLNNLMKYCQ